MTDLARHIPDKSGSARTEDEAFLRLAEIVREESGILLSPEKRSLVAARLSKRLRVLGLSDLAQYCRYVDGEGGKPETRQLISLLTTNVTRFFREGHHFEALKTTVLPPLVQRARSGGRVRIWSAGCSSGEEPYSIAIQILEVMPDAGRFDIRILGTDIDADMIAKGRKGHYAIAEDDQLTDARRRAHFTDAECGPGRLSVSPAVRELVTLAELNLLRPWPMQGKFDIIFCRNVVIYFDAGTQAGLWQRFADVLVPGGSLFIGHSERLNLPASQTTFESTGITQYRRM